MIFDIKKLSGKGKRRDKTLAKFFVELTPSSAILIYALHCILTYYREIVSYYLAYSFMKKQKREKKLCKY